MAAVVAPPSTGAPQPRRPASVGRRHPPLYISLTLHKRRLQKPPPGPRTVDHGSTKLCQSRPPPIASASVKTLGAPGLGLIWCSKFILEEWVSAPLSVA
ncbi:hypothetical protein SETIT_3G314600v2 [Setaria italica]|uniref:Uncharacterized protein n=1 Tax=Setaria italica TaxID=4555 RepID=A0A368QL11_SETIT|nr:hypothetical protein SETIT_3G314600v2 [Setaria italica]